MIMNKKQQYIAPQTVKFYVNCTQHLLTLSNWDTASETVVGVHVDDEVDPSNGDVVYSKGNNIWESWDE